MEKNKITVNYGNVKIVKSKYWFSDGSTETNYFQPDGNKKTVYTYKKEQENVRQKK